MLLMQYEVVKKIGQGAEGPVMLLKQSDSDQQFVLKTNATSLNAVDIERVFTLDHKNVIKVLAFDEKDGKQICVMEYANMGDLSQYLAQRERDGAYLMPEEIIDIFDQICRGLHYLHTHGIIHGDLTPNNILLHNENGRIIVKLADFLQNNQTQLSYAAPELVGDAKPTQQSDIWSLGVILFLMAKRRLPFVNISSIFSPIQLKLNDVPYCFEKIIQSCLVKNPSARIRLIKVIQALERRVMQRKEDGSIVISSCQTFTNMDFLFDDAEDMDDAINQAMM